MDDEDEASEREPLDQPWPWGTVAIVFAIGIWLLYRDRDVAHAHSVGWLVWTLLTAAGAAWGGWSGAQTKRVRGKPTGPKTAVIGMTTLSASLAGGALSRESSRFVSAHTALWFVGALVVGFMVGYVAYIAWWERKVVHGSG